MTGPVLCVTLNPVLDTTFFVDAMRPVYRTDAQRVTHVAGGKGNNVARALAILGERGHSLVALGGMTGHDIAEVMAAEDYESTAAWVSGDSRLQITVIDAAGEQRAFYAPAAPFTENDAASVRRSFHSLLRVASAVCLCGSSPAGWGDALFGELIEAARTQGIPTLLDSSGPALIRGLAARPDIVKINRSEAAAWLGRGLAAPEDELAALAALATQVGQWAILTLGEQGALFSADGQAWRATPPPGAARNPIASGDAMTAGLVSGLLRSASPTACFRLGMAAAAANTLTWDACRFTLADVARLAPAVTLHPQ